MNCKIGQDLPNGSRKLGLKLKLFYDFIMIPEINDNEIVLFIDAYDVFYSGNASETLKRYNELLSKNNKPIIFGAECCCYPDASKSSLYPKTSSAFRFLNSGLFMGKIWAFRECMSDYIYDDDVNDQLWWTEMFLGEKGKRLIQLDYDCSLFLNCVWIDEKELTYEYDEKTSDLKVFYSKIKTPQFVHGNGPSKRLIEPFLLKKNKNFTW